MSSRILIVYETYISSAIGDTDKIEKNNVGFLTYTEKGKITCRQEGSSTRLQV